MSKIEVKIANNEELKKWDDFVDSSPIGTIFHKINWLLAVEKHTKSKFYPLIGYKGEKLIAIFPIFYLKKFIIKMIFSPPPKCEIPYLGPIFISFEHLNQRKIESILNGFIDSSLEFLREELRPDYIYIKSSPGFCDLRSFIRHNFHIIPRYDYILNIENPNDLIKKFSPDLRRNIKKMEKKEVQVKIGSFDDIKKVYQLIKKRYEEQNIRFPLSFNYLSEIYRSFSPQNLRIFILKHKHNIITGGIKPIYRRKIIDWVGQPKVDLFDGTPNDFLHFNIIKWGFKEGLEKYRIIGANTKRIAEFKAKYDPNLELSFCIEKANIKSLIAKTFYKKFLSRKFLLSEQ
ncbi:MAG: GNAT family N-acetyltransferase [Candidatus Helarchaeota archaeon]